MSISDIIGIVLAVLTFFGVIVALGLGIASIRETRNWQRTGYRNKLLDDILDWALNILFIGHKGAVTELSNLEEAFKNLRSMQTYEFMQEGNWELGYLEALHRGRCLVLLASNFGNELRDNIQQLVDELETEVAICKKYRLKYLDIPDDIEEFRKLLKQSGDESQKQNPKTTEAVNKVVTEVTRLKTMGLIIR